MFSQNSYNHKRAAFCHYFDRLLKVPQNQESFNIELNRIFRIGLNNGYQLKWLKQLYGERKKVLLCKEIYSGAKAKEIKSYRKLLYHGDISSKLARLVEDDNRKIAFYSKPNIGRKLFNRVSPSSKMYKSGIYKLNCNDCEGSYVGQTARNFNVRIKEHMASYKHKNDKSNFAYHLLQEEHTFDENRGVEILHVCEGGRKMDVLDFRVLK
uniref:GIY-YIG domain-containing protein n=1 Tax=Cacopsylla melanoneura TaxID=428564 RepID=A0A8D8Q6E9_9HEMI